MSDEQIQCFEYAEADAREAKAAIEALLRVATDTADALEADDPDLSLYWLAEQLRAAIERAQGAGVGG